MSTGPVPGPEPAYQPWRRRPRPEAARRGWLGVLALVGGLAVPADLAEPALPALGLPMMGLPAMGWLALAAALALPAGLLLAALRPARLGRLPWLPARLVPLLALLALAQILAGGPRGLLGAHLPEVAGLQESLLHVPPSPWPAERLRAALAERRPVPRPRPASADEALYNALVLARHGQARAAASALADSLRLPGRPRPDALLLLEALRDMAETRAPLAAVTLPPDQAALLAALEQPEAPDRAAALAALAEMPPAEAMIAEAALAHARIAASLPDGPTLAAAAQIAMALDGLLEEARFAAFADAFLDPGRALRLRQGLEALGWTREVAARRPSVALLAPPPGDPGPIRLRVLPPEPARAVQWWQDGAWVALPEGPAGPELALPRPFHPAMLRFRHLDRDGVPGPPVEHAFDPAAAIRQAAQRALQAQGPFGLYQPGWLEPGRLNPLPLAGRLLPGLSAIEWRSDADLAPRRIEVAPRDDAVLAADPPRLQVEFPVPEAARLLVLVAVYADGSRGEPVELPIR
ncbi:hypothetical protein [Falsiroseomonas selenitidurans]|uniref:Uncharacterized protein n=1 Tax=Falsiroseomonas selenitidurans TaxID=2716335 RepID=A0ABX1EEA4_9PROT|nr:hypothetical protein [Falsiroseomonas selenitidurans]NKC34242.1 hypothetical protein [Falsiroseomonas selenitidurans]